MAEYSASNIRNISLLGHSRSGKTTLVEACLFNSGTISRMGDTGDGSAVCDWDDEEHARGISLGLAVAPYVHQNVKCNMVDTPGDPSFLGEVISGVSVTESSLILVDAVAGAEVGTELAWMRIQNQGRPCAIVINKMDRENADWERALESLAGACPGGNLVPVQLPVGQALEFQGIVDLIHLQTWMGDGETATDIPEGLADLVEEYRMILVEAAAEADDDLTEKYLEDEDLSTAEVQQGLAQGLAAGSVIPVFFTAAQANIGIKPLMDALCWMTPAADQADPALADPDGETLTAVAEGGGVAALSCKTIIDRYMGRINYVRVFQGSLVKGEQARDSRNGTVEELVNLHTVLGKQLDTTHEIGAGDIGALSKWADVTTGDTVSDPESGLVLAPPDYPMPLYSLAVSPATKADSAKLGQSLSQVAEEDPTLTVASVPETKQTLLQGVGDIQVDVALKRLDTRYGVQVETTVPKVPYMETVTRTGSAQYRHKKQTGGAGQFAEVHMRVEPLARGQGFEYESEVYGGAISSVFLPSIEKGVKQVMDQGVVAGFPAVDLKVVVFDGKEHPVDSKDIAFQIAGREVFKMAASEAGATLLEPIYRLSISVPDDNMGDIMGDLTNRRGRVLGMDQMANRSIVNAEVPYAEIMRYGTDLRSMTQGRGTYEIEFLHYEEVPQHLIAKVIAAHKEDEREE